MVCYLYRVHSVHTAGGEDNSKIQCNHLHFFFHRIIMCMMCGDSFSIESVLQPFLAMQTCQVVNNDRYHVIQFDTYISDVKRKVEIIIASYHEASFLRDEGCHGYILIYSAIRKASYSVLE